MQEINVLAAKNPYLSELELKRICKQKGITLTRNLLLHFKNISEDYRTR